MNHHKEIQQKYQTIDLNIFSPSRASIIEFLDIAYKLSCIKCFKKEIEFLNDQRSRNYF